MLFAPPDVTAKNVIWMLQIAVPWDACNELGSKKVKKVVLGGW